jgi:hypothetical protein
MPASSTRSITESSRLQGWTHPATARGYAALAQWTLHNREHLVVLRPGRFGLLVHAPFYADEIRALDEFRTETECVAPQELGTGPSADRVFGRAV